MKIGLVFLVSLVALVGCAHNAPAPSTPTTTVVPAPASLAIDCQGSPKRCYDQATITCNGDWHLAGLGDFDGNEGHYRMYVRCGEQ